MHAYFYTLLVIVLSFSPVFAEEGSTLSTKHGWLFEQEIMPEESIKTLKSIEPHTDPATRTLQGGLLNWDSQYKIERNANILLKQLGGDAKNVKATFISQAMDGNGKLSWDDQSVIVNEFGGHILNGFDGMTFGLKASAQHIERLVGEAASYSSRRRGSKTPPSVLLNAINTQIHDIQQMIHKSRYSPMNRYSPVSSLVDYLNFANDRLRRLGVVNVDKTGVKIDENKIDEAWIEDINNSNKIKHRGDAPFVPRDKMDIAQERANILINFYEKFLHLKFPKKLPL